MKLHLNEELLPEAVKEPWKHTKYGLFVQLASQIDEINDILRQKCRS